MQDPTAWFDQFLPSIIDPKAQTGNWCARHWAPCPALGANGMGATVELIQIFINELAPSGHPSAAEMNKAMEEANPICCKLGDARMYTLWGKWGPALAEPARE